MRISQLYKKEHRPLMMILTVIFTGPQLDWDPDIVAAMDEDFDFDDPDNELDDDFMVIANDENAEIIHEDV